MGGNTFSPCKPTQHTFILAACLIIKYADMQGLTFEKLPEAVAELHNRLTKIERLLQEQTHSRHPKDDKLLSVAEAANLLDLSVPTIYGYVQRQEIPVNKRGKRLYFSKQELTEWVKAGRKKTVSEIEAEAESFLISKKKGGKAI